MVGALRQMGNHPLTCKNTVIPSKKPTAENDDGLVRKER